MRAAPPVQATVCGAGTWLAVQCALWALSAFVLAYWFGGRVWPDSWMLMLACLGFAALAAALARFGLHQPQRQLVWDGESWTVTVASGDRLAGQPMPMMDLGSWMLLRITPPAVSGRAGGLRQAMSQRLSLAWWQGLSQEREQWLALSARDNAAVWPQLRVALHTWRSPLRQPGAASSPLPGA